MAVLATDPPDVGHVPSVPANRQAALACDFALLLRAHRGKAAAALFLTASLGLRTGSTTGHLAGACRAPGLATATALTGASAGLSAAFGVARLLFHDGSIPAGLRAAAGSALAVRFFGLNTGLVETAGASQRGSPLIGFSDGKRVPGL